MQVKLISKTQGINELETFSLEDLIAHNARVSNPSNQLNTATTGKLLQYCMREKHWSVFEQVSFTVEIQTSRAIAPQILRHRSFCFQEFSQRYQAIEGHVADFEYPEPRRQDTKNRQNSLDDLDADTKEWFKTALIANDSYGVNLYKKALKKGIAKECARFFLPPNTKTTLYMSGNVRSFIHYLLVRLHPSTQKEHRDIAQGIWQVFEKLLPSVGESLKLNNPELFT